MNLTPQQEAFIDAIRSTTSSIALIAVAGSGKTTALVQAVNSLPSSKSVLCVAFNKRIADELQTRMPDTAVCRTMNSLGHRAWGRNIGARLSLDTDKIKNLILPLIHENPELGDLYQEIKQVVEMARANGIVPDGSPSNPEGLIPDTPDTWLDICNRLGIYENDATLGAIIAAAQLVLKESIRQAWHGRIDFSDQLYMPVICKAPFDRFDIVFVDEAQDINPVQREMIRRSLQLDTGRLVAVGDPHQAIYAFRGADHDSMQIMIDQFHCTEMPLTVSFRCPKAVVKAARAYVSHIESAESAPDGLVLPLRRYSEKEFRYGDTILCRNCAPLMGMAFWLIRHGVGCRVLGGDIGKGLARIVKQQEAKDIPQLVDRLEVWYQFRLRKLLSKGKPIEALTDKYESLMAVIEHSNVKTVDALLAVIDKMFSPQRCPVTLSTIHKAKGLEWERVFLLDKHLIPSKYAEAEWQLTQEYNLAYVAITRAKSELYYITSEGHIPQAELDAEQAGFDKQLAEEDERLEQREGDTYYSPSKEELK